MQALALTFPAIDPVAIQIGPLAIRWYGLAYLAGLMLGWWYARRLAGRPELWGATPRPGVDSLDDLLLYVTLGIVGGGRLGEILFYNLPHYAANPLEILKVWQGGMSFHGGLIGAIFAGLIYARRQGVPALAIMDLMAAVAPIGLFFGRIANFINGELWGRASDVPWAMVFPDADDLPRHPSQLYEAALEGALLLVLLSLAIRRWGFRRPGLIGGLFLCGYGLARLFVEFFREPEPQQGFLFGGWLTMGMLLSLPMIAIGAAVFLAKARAGRAEA